MTPRPRRATEQRDSRMNIFKDPRYVVEAIQLLCRFEKPKKLGWLKVVDWILAIVFTVVVLSMYLMLIKCLR